MNEDKDELIERQKVKIQKLQNAVDKAELELVNSKQKIGEIMNMIMETGQNDLFDQIYSSMGKE